MQLQDQAVEYDCYEQSVRCSKRNRPALRRNSFPSLTHHNRLFHPTPPKCGKTLPHFGGRIPVRDGTLSNMISMPTACPFCRSNRLVTGKLAGGIEESAAYIVLAGVSISFWKGEIKGRLGMRCRFRFIRTCGPRSAGTAGSDWRGVQYLRIDPAVR